MKVFLLIFFIALNVWGNTPDIVGEKSVDEYSHLLNVLKGYNYSGKSGRDPFKKWDYENQDEVQKSRLGKSGKKLAPLERWGVDELKLLGVIWGVSRPRAMIQDPSGKVHTLEKNAKLGLNDGYIAVIREGEVVVVESFRTDKDVSYQTKVLKVRQ